LRPPAEIKKPNDEAIQLLGGWPPDDIEVPRWWSSKITSTGAIHGAILQRSVLISQKNVFQVHAVDEAGSVVVRTKAEGSSEARAKDT
jgi:hypothetical protein